MKRDTEGKIGTERRGAEKEIEHQRLEGVPAEGIGNPGRVRGNNDTTGKGVSVCVCLFMCVSIRAPPDICQSNHRWVEPMTSIRYVYQTLSFIRKSTNKHKTTKHPNC